jgi:uncharacterized protein (DUF1810 family)
MASESNLDRFLRAQQGDYEMALAEINKGKKRSHWMWYIFPQIQGLGFSQTSKYYAIKDIVEAEAYLKHPILGERLIVISKALLAIKEKDAYSIFGSPDDVKLKSSMTLFAAVPGADLVFQTVLIKFFDGEKDNGTLQIISKQK